jgi:hypothetical protein
MVDLLGALFFFYLSHFHIVIVNNNILLEHKKYFTLLGSGNAYYARCILGNFNSLDAALPL